MNRRMLNGWVVALGLTLAFAAARLEAASVTVEWDRNPERDIAGYTVYWGTQSGVYTASRSVVGVTSLTITSLEKGRTYYFAIQAYNKAGVKSDLSPETSVFVGTNPLSVDAWMRKFHITDMNADDDGDGVSNQEEYDAQTDPTLPNVWHLTGDSTGLFGERLAIANPGTDPADITLTFLPDNGAPIARDYTIPAESRTTLDVQTISGLSSRSASAVVTARRGGVVVERTMMRAAPDGQPHSGYTGKGVASPLTRWYFAGGDAVTSDTRLVVANPNSSAATISLTYLLEGGSALTGVYTAEPTSRLIVPTDEVPGLSGHQFSAVVDSSLPVIAERSSYQAKGAGAYKVYTNAGGIEAPSSTWYVAQSAVGPLFDQYILISNPNPCPSTVTVRFLTPSDVPVAQVYTLPPQSRTTIHVNAIPELEDAVPPAAITATEPVVVESATYWPANSTTWYGGHASAAAARPGTKWVLAEGETGGTASFTNYILLANPSDRDARIRVTLLRANGAAPVVSTHTVAANSCLTLGRFPLESGERFGTVVESTNGTPIVVERSMYWGAGGLRWSGGSNDTGLRLR
jgi:hypothetical protein